MTAVQLRPAGVVSADVPDRLPVHIAGWLLAAAGSPHTRTAYQADLRGWLGFCHAHHIGPYQAGMPHVDAWHRWMAETPSQRTGRRPAPATLARRVSTVASFYQWLYEEGHVDRVPVRKSSRPKAPTESTTVALAKAEAEAFIARAGSGLESARDAAVVVTLLFTGLRVSELAALDVGDMRPEEGHAAVLTVRGKGGKVRRVPAAAPVVDALAVYLAGRAGPAGQAPADEPLLCGRGGGRLTQQGVDRMVKRIARAAGVTSWSRLSPHSLRHSCATLQLDAGVGIERVQDLLGHANPSTTRRYDRARGRLDRMVAGVEALAASLGRS